MDFQLQQGICCKSDTYEYSIDRVPSERCRITAAPTLKKSYLEHTSKELLEELCKIVVLIAGIQNVQVKRRAVHFYVAGPTSGTDGRVMRYSPEYSAHIRDIYLELKTAVKAYLDDYLASKRPRVPSLNRIMLEKLSNDAAFKIRGYIHYSALHGTDDAIRVLVLKDLWRQH
jgi:hypothetical protein